MMHHLSGKKREGVNDVHEEYTYKQCMHFKKDEEEPAMLSH